MAVNKLPVLNINNFKLPKNTQPDFYIKTFQEHKKEHPFIIKPHSHDFYLLMVFTKGGGTHTIDLNTYPIKPGSVFFMSPSEVHSWQLNDDTDGYILFFNASFYLLDFKVNNLLNIPFFRPENKIRSGFLNTKELPKIKTIIKTMHDESTLDSINQKNILRSYLDILLLKFDLLFNSADKKTINRSSLVPKLEVLIEQHFKDHLPISFYASQLNISLPQLNTTANNLLSKSVNDLVHERIILEAKRLLIYSDLTVSQISDELNYNDNSYFTRFFKKMTKLTPEQFRKRFI
jgi:AraC family transcriptional regulator, transcriptional activator of pobA